VVVEVKERREGKEESIPSIVIQRGNTVEDSRPGTQTGALVEKKSVVQKLQEKTYG
jgi:hypothetical protein